MASLANRVLFLVGLPVELVTRLPDLIDAVIQMPAAIEHASSEVRDTRQELEEAEYRLDRLIQMSEVAIDEMRAANANMQDGNARLEKLTPIAETAVADMETGIRELREALQRFRELSSTLDDIPLVDTET